MGDYQMGDVHKVEILTREEMLAKHAGSSWANDWVPDIRVSMCVGYDDSEITVCFDYAFTGNFDDEYGQQYDVDLSAANNDWAGPRDQIDAMGAAVKKWETLNLHREIIGRKIVVSGCF